MNKSVVFTSENDIIGRETEITTAEASEIARIVSVPSSGTMGKRKKIFFTEEELEQTICFFMAGMSEICHEGDIVGIFMPYGHERGLNDLLSEALLRIGTVPIVYGVYSDYETMREKLECRKPQVIIGMPWNIRLLMLSFPELKPGAVLLSGDYIPDTLKKLIKTAWGVETKVFRHYGLTETCYGLAVDRCEDSGMIIRKADFSVKIIDPKNLEEVTYGNKGELVISSKKRRAIPLVNYMTGDIASMSDAETITGIYGRKGVPRQYYHSLDALCAFDWLLDFCYSDDMKRIDTVVTKDAPEDVKEIIKRITHAEVNVSIKDYSAHTPFSNGKLPVLNFLHK